MIPGTWLMVVEDTALGFLYELAPGVGVIDHFLANLKAIEVWNAGGILRIACHFGRSSNKGLC